ncbi:MAG: SIMPL domain-containing protein [Bacteroidia bacterium]|nr:SIMPL domain-containing protein [Bacteroidia bacterium]
MKFITIILGGLLFSCLSLMAQVGGNQLYDRENKSYNSDESGNAAFPNKNPSKTVEIYANNEILIRVAGLMNVIADKYVAVFNVIQVAETASQADALMNERIAVLRTELKHAGFDSTAIFVDLVSFLPRYDYQADSKLFSKSYNEVPAGFELQKNIMIQYKKAFQLDAIITAAAQAEIYDLIKVDYFLSSQAAYRDSLRAHCHREFRNKVKAYESLGIRMDSVKRVANENFTITYPPNRYFSYQAFSRPSLNAARKRTSANTKEIYKAVSKYYNQVEPDNYDVIINPIVSEPAVQITYTMAVKFMLPETPAKSNYYIITPTGEVKPFNPK